MTAAEAQQLMDYINTYPSPYLRFYASDMILSIDSDAAYLVVPGAKSRVAGYFYLTNAMSSQNSGSPNAPVLVECKVLRHVVSSAAESETAGVYHNAQVAIPIRIF